MIRLPKAVVDDLRKGAVAEHSDRAILCFAFDDGTAEAYGRDAVLCFGMPPLVDPETGIQSYPEDVFDDGSKTTIYTTTVVDMKFKANYLSTVRKLPVIVFNGDDIIRELGDPDAAAH